MAGTLASRAIKPLIGAEVLADKAALLGGEHAAEIRELLEARGVLVFPGPFRRRGAHHVHRNARGL